MVALGFILEVQGSDQKSEHTHQQQIRFHSSKFSEGGIENTSDTLGFTGIGPNAAFCTNTVWFAC
jgi:hypothetical protein